MGSIINAADYKIFIGNDLLKQFDLLLDEKKISSSAKIILVDENTRKHCFPLLLQQVPSLRNVEVFEIKSGEEGKSVAAIESIWNYLSNTKADRSSVLINLGGGALCDAGAFAATTFMRGIQFINIPTTLLSMVDASVGGKNGINFNGVKNLVGTFANPLAVFAAPEFLNTLFEDEIRNGFAEVIKHSLISDRGKWNAVKSVAANFKNTNWELVISESVELKNKIVQSDFHDRNLRHVLNFGHTIGHALESYSLKHHSSPLKHGEAVAIGIVGEVWLSQQLCSFSNEDANEIYSFISKVFTLKLIFDARELLLMMRSDKKNAEGKINFTLLKSIGEPVINQKADEALIIQSLEFVLQHLNSAATPA